LRCAVEGRREQVQFPSFTVYVCCETVRSNQFILCWLWDGPPFHRLTVCVLP
jgi:hypothetical protein